MTETTFETAKRCPKCDLPGEEVSVSPVTTERGRQAFMHMIYCRNDACAWFNTSYVVQTNEDGSVPPPYSGHDQKRYPRLSQESQSRIEDNVKRQLEAETQSGGGEIRNPRG